MNTPRLWAVLLLILALNALNSMTTRADNRVNFQIDRIPESDFNQNTVCILTIWATTGDHTWDIQAFNIGVDYNEDVMEDVRLWMVNEAIFDDSYDVTVKPQPLNDPTWFRFNVLKFGGQIKRLGANQKIWLARILITIKGDNIDELMANVLEEDHVFMDTETGQTQIFNGLDMLNFNTQDELGWGLSAPNTSQIIASCSNEFYQFTSCHEFVESKTEIPIQTGAARWFPEQGSNGYGLARFQYDFDNDHTPSSPDRTRDFDRTVLEGIGDECRCAWEAQTESRFNWATTTNGGRFYFATEPNELGGIGIARSLAARTYLASVDSPQGDALVRIKDSTVCGQEDKTGQSSRIVFNNTAQYYDEFPNLRWTTGAPHGDGPFDCGGYECMDFRSVLHHELGHYLGLAHSVHPDDLMHGWGFFTNDVHVRFTQCDADRVRRLYSPEIIGDPPVNFSAIKGGDGRDITLMTACELVDNVKIEEDIWDGIAQSSTIQILPSPVQIGQEFHIRYALENGTKIRVTLHDLFGRQVALLASGYRGAGAYSMTVNNLDVPAGVLVVRLETAYGVSNVKTLVIR